MDWKKKTKKDGCPGSCNESLMDWKNEKKKKKDDDCPASFCTYLPCGEWKRFQHYQERTCHDATVRVYVSEVQTNLQREMASICCWPRMAGIISRSAPLLYYDAASVRYFGVSHVLSPAIRTLTRGGQQRARTCDQTRPVTRNLVTLTPTHQQVSTLGWTVVLNFEVNQAAGLPGPDDSGGKERACK